MKELGQQALVALADGSRGEWDGYGFPLMGPVTSSYAQSIALV